MSLRQLFSVAALFLSSSTIADVVKDPQVAAQAIHQVVFEQNFGIGCVALILHPQLPSRDFVFLTQMQKYLSSQQMDPTMVLRGNRVIPPRMRQRCLRQTTILVALYNDPGLNHLMNDATQDDNFMSTMFWLIFVRSGVTTVENILYTIQQQMEIVLDGVYIDMRSSVLVLDLDTGQLTEIYRIYLGGPLKVNPLSVWMNEDEDGQPAEFNWIQMRYSMIRSQLDGHTIRAVVENSSVSRLEWNHSRGAYDLVGGYYAKIWQVLESRLNFTTEFCLTNLSGSIQYPEDGRWVGIESWLEQNLSDAVASPILNSPEKQNDFFITWPIYQKDFYLFVKDPLVDQTIPWSLYLEPFQLSLWMVFGCSIIILALSLRFVALKSISLWPKSETYTLHNSLFFTFRIFCNQGQEFDPKSLSTRIVILTGYFTAILVFSSYSAVLISFLTTERVNLPFDSYDTILNDGSYQLGVIYNSGEYKFLSQSKSEHIRKVWNLFMNTSSLNFPRSLDQAWDRVCQERFAFLLPADHGLPIIMDQLPCQMRVLTPNYIKPRYALAFDKSFSFRSLILYHLQDMKDSGILMRISNEWKGELERNMQFYTPRTTISVKFLQISPLLTFLSIASGLSIIIFIIEKNLFITTKTMNQKSFQYNKIQCGLNRQ